MERTVSRRIEGGKFLTFFLADEEYALEILKVQEIIGMQEITPIPGAAEHVRGVINLRGRIVPVVDLRRRFGMADATFTPQSCIIVVDVGGTKTGVMVDSVSDVLKISTEQIDPVPAFGPEVREDYLLGVGKGEGGVKLLLDIGRLLSETRPDELDGAA